MPHKVAVLYVCSNQGLLLIPGKDERAFSVVGCFKTGDADEYYLHEGWKPSDIELPYDLRHLEYKAPYGHLQLMYWNFATDGMTDL